MFSITIKHRELVFILKTCNHSNLKEQKKAVLNELVNQFQLNGRNDLIIALKEKLRISFFNNFQKRFKTLSKNRKTYDVFESKYASWLSNDFKFNFIENARTEMTQPGAVGRPQLPYELSAKRTQEKKVADINKDINIEQCFEVAKKKLRLSGNTNGIKLINVITDEHSADRLFQSIQKPESVRLSAEEALALLVEANLTKSAYNLLRATSRKANHDLYPSYEEVAQAKKAAYPDGITVTEVKCEVALQNLVDHTITRLMQYLKIHFDDDSNTELKLVFKYGFDGTNSNDYKQKSKDKKAHCTSIFCCSLVPLQLVNTNSNEILWKNPRPSSSRFCRPIKILFEKETVELCQRTEANLKQQIEELQDIVCYGCSVSSEMLLTMIDGKVCNALTDSSSQSCHLCDARISKMNDIDAMMNRAINEEFLCLGFSVLHAHIRFMELVLHISYRMELKLWRIGKDKQEIIKTRKKEIQDQFRNELGILVDAPVQNSGNTNDGNTARRFFDNLNIVARITGFDENLLYRLKTILGVISMQRAINVQAFRMYCKDTAIRYADIYSWYYMPPSLHIILIHGWRILDQLIVPIGMITEEAQESNHKHLKKSKDRFSRKISRIATNTDIFQRLLLNSDPLISLSRKLPTKKVRNLTDDMKCLIDIGPEEDENTSYDQSTDLSDFSDSDEE